MRIGDDVSSDLFTILIATRRLCHDLLFIADKRDDIVGCLVPDLQNLCLQISSRDADVVVVVDDWLEVLETICIRSER